MTPGADSGRLPAAYLVPGSSSFTEFLSAQAPTMLPSGRTLPPGAAIDAPHGTTIVTLTYAGGVVMAGDRAGHDGQPDRQPRHGEGLRDRRVQPGRHRRHRRAGHRAGAAVPGRARALREDRGHPDVARGQGQPARLDDPGQPRDGDAGPVGRAALRRLRRRHRHRPDLLLRRHRRLLRGARPPQRGVGLAVRPRLAEEALPPGRHPRRRRAGGRRGALRRRRRRLGHRWPDVGRRIWPTIGIVDDDGARFVPDDEIAPVVDAIIAPRVDNPGGAR